MQFTTTLLVIIRPELDINQYVSIGIYVV